MGMSVKTIESVIANGGKLIGTGKNNGIQVFKTMLEDGGYKLNSFTREGKAFKTVIKNPPCKLRFRNEAFDDTYRFFKGYSRTTGVRKHLTGEDVIIAHKSYNDKLSKVNLFSLLRFRPASQKGSAIDEYLNIEDRKNIVERIFRKPSSTRQSKYNCGARNYDGASEHVRVRQKMGEKDCDIGIYNYEKGSIVGDPYPSLRTNMEGYEQFVKSDALKNMPRSIDKINVLLDKLNAYFKV